MCSSPCGLMIAISGYSGTCLHLQYRHSAGNCLLAKRTCVTGVGWKSSPGERAELKIWAPFLHWRNWRNSFPHAKEVLTPSGRVEKRSSDPQVPASYWRNSHLQVKGRWSSHERWKDGTQILKIWAVFMGAELLWQLFQPASRDKRKPKSKQSSSAAR